MASIGQRVLCVPRVSISSSFIQSFCEHPNQIAMIRLERDEASMEDLDTLKKFSKGYSPVVNVMDTENWQTKTFRQNNGNQKPNISELKYLLPIFRTNTVRNLGIFELPRDFAEDNLSFRQLVVGVFVWQKGKLLLLKNKNGDMNNAYGGSVYTSVGGHCELMPDDKRSPLLNFRDVLWANLKREFDEELIYDYSMLGRSFSNILFRGSHFYGESTMMSELSNICCPDLIATTFNDFDYLKDTNVRPDISAFHIGYIYIMELPSYIPIEGFSSGEPEKNEVVIVNVKQDEYGSDGDGNVKYADIKDKCDSWVRLIFG